MRYLLRQAFFIELVHFIGIQGRKYKMIRKFTGLLAAVCLLSPNMVMAEDAGRDWGSSMSFSSPSAVANAFNAALAIYNLKRPGGAAGGGTVYNCPVAGACPQGGTVSQWNGVSVTTITGSSGITVDNTIDAESNQEAGIANCTGAPQDCTINLN